IRKDYFRMAFKLQVIWENENSQKLTFNDGMPSSVHELSKKIEDECDLQGQQFRLQYMDKDFNKFMNLKSVSNLSDKDTVRVVFLNANASCVSHVPDVSPVAHSHSSDFHDADNENSSTSASDTDILSSSDSTSARSSLWPSPFVLPRFPYDVQLKLDQGNSAFRSSGKFLIPDPKLKSGILDALAEEIINFKAYPSYSEFSDVAEALVDKHPCLKEQGSESGYSGWKMSLKFKLANYRRTLRGLGCPEVTVNALKHKPEGKHSPAYGIKKPKKAEVNYCPVFPDGQTTESQEKMRVELLAELQKNNNSEIVRKLMDMTFAYRRHEIVHDSPFVVDFKSRWPALFQVREINAEFRRITTLPLQSKFLYQLDRFSDDLLKVFLKKGGVIRKRIQDAMVPMSQNDNIETKRECILKGLCIYLNEDPQHLVKEYL
ncbi:sterile alpha motif domain-containing protein 3-like isoform X1, partial [Clarias magur]